MNIVKFIQFNKPNKNGRYYTRECVENAIKNFTKTEFFVQTTMYATSTNDAIALVKNVRTDENYLLGDCYFFEDAKQFEGENINIRPIGSGTVNENGCVQNDYRILGFVVVRQGEVNSDTKSANVTIVEKK